MVARKLILHLMVLSPAMLLSSIAIESRIGFEALEEPAILPESQQRITAYVDLVRQTEQTLGEGTQATPDEVRRLAQMWIDGARSGHLRSLLPQHPQDSPREGARGQIFESRARVLGFLQTLARAQVHRGEYSQAAQDALRVVWVAETMKYSELYVVGASSMEQRTALTHLLQALPHLPEDEVALVRAECQEVLDRQEPIDKLIQLSRQQFQTGSVGGGAFALSGEDGQKLAAIETMVRSDADPDRVIDEIRRTLSGSHSAGMPIYLSGVKLGIQAQEQLRVKLQTIAWAQKKRPTLSGGL